MTKTLCRTNYPVSIFFIVVNEFCERFSYYGMRAVLTLYFLAYLHWDKDLSTAVFHAFASLCYFTPVLGAIIADSWLGKYKTIVYLSILYVIGHLVKSVGAIPMVGDKDMHIALSMIGLILIAIGTGGIKPCVAAFGGDQFDEEHMDERQKFFSIFYMSINAGSFLSTVITPILRSDVQCFGGDCYALAFGVPAALMVVSLAVFMFGSGLYKMCPPQGNILLEVCNCVGFAVKNRWRRSKEEPKREHWLDWAEEKYSKRLIQEIKMVLRVLVLYIPLPMFWALFDQQGSRWTLQATGMDMAFGDSFVIKPDQMQMLNALLILVFVPIFDLVIYPLVALCRINVTPLRKMNGGMVLAALAFALAALVDVHVIETVVDPAPAGKCLLQVYNLADGNVSLQFPNNSLFPEPIQRLQDPPKYVTLPLEAPSKEVKILVSQNGIISECTQTFDQEEAYSLVLYPNAAGIQCKLVHDNIKKSEDGNPLLRFLNTQSETVNVTVEDVSFHVLSGYSVTLNKTVAWGRYPHVSCSTKSKKCYGLDLGLLDFGASYTAILMEESGEIVAYKMEDVKANNVHIAWQIPQYILITAAEVMFSITGLEFSYSQSPASMKSVLQAGWLFTVAIGNLIVLVVAEGAGLEQWKEFALFAVLLFGVCIIFGIMSCLYTYVDPEQLDKLNVEDSRKEEDDDDDDMKEKMNNIHLNKMEKSTRL